MSHDHTVRDIAVSIYDWQKDMITAALDEEKIFYSFIPGPQKGSIGILIPRQTMARIEPILKRVTDTINHNTEILQNMDPDMTKH